MKADIDVIIIRYAVGIRCLANKRRLFYILIPGSGDSLSADFDDSMEVDFKDFAVLAAGWQTTYDIDDLSMLVDQWLQVADPNIEINIYGDSNEGYVDIGITGFTSNTQRVFLLADGKYVGEIFGFAGGYTLIMDVSESGSQERQRSQRREKAGPS